jgi:hypothetical protein
MHYFNITLVQCQSLKYILNILYILVTDTIKDSEWKCTMKQWSEIEIGSWAKQISQIIL